MRSSERTPTGIRFWSIAFLTGTQYRADEASLQLYRADNVVLGVGHVQHVAPPSQTLRPTQSCQTRLTTVSRVTLLPGSGHMIKGQRVAVDAVDGIALPQR